MSSLCLSLSSLFAAGLFGACGPLAIATSSGGGGSSSTNNLESPDTSGDFIEQEPNETLSSGNDVGSLSIGDTVRVRGDLDQGFGVDVFVASISQSSRVTFTAQPLASNVDIVVESLGQFGEVLETFNANGNGGAESGSGVAFTGTAGLRVSRHFATNTAASGYTLDITLSPPPVGYLSGWLLKEFVPDAGSEQAPRVVTKTPATRFR